MLKAGQTILLPKPGQETMHLWVVVVAPDPVSHETVIVNFTSQRAHSDNSVVLHSSDHPFVQHPTVVFYADARIVDAKHIAAAMKAGTFQTHHDCSSALVQRIQTGLSTSPFTPGKVKAFVNRRLSAP